MFSMLRHAFKLSVIIASLSIAAATAASAQEVVSDGNGIGTPRPYTCWTTSMEFYDPVAFPYFEVDGYYFDANPFTTTAWRENNYAMIMRSSKGWRLADMSGRKLWTDARIYVKCFVVDYFYGLISQPYAIVAWELGSVVDRSVACNSSGPITDPADIGYDPYEGTGTYDDSSPNGCLPGSGSQSPDLPPGTICETGWVAIDISYDGGVTWSTLWEGIVKICR